MKKIAAFCLLAGAGLLVSGPARAEDGKFSIHGEVRARYEFLSNYNDTIDHTTSGTSADDDFDLMPYRVRLSVTGEFTDNVVGHIEIQNNGVFGGQFPIGSLGSPDSPQGQFTRSDIGTSETVLYQGYVDLNNIAGTIFSLRVGRSEHTLGNELLLGDLDFYSGMTFDGISGSWDFEAWDLDVFFYNITEGNVSVGAVVAAGLPNGGDEDVVFWGGHASFDIGDDGQFIEPYIFNKDDNAGTNLLGFLDPHQFYTVGALYGRRIDADDVADGAHWDWSAEVAFQTGDYDENLAGGGPGFGMLACPAGDCDISASVFEGALGYNWAHGDSTSRVYIGFFTASGDDDPTDSDIEAFFPLWGDIHANNRLGDADLFGLVNANFVSGVANGGFGFANVTDLSVGYGLEAGNHTFNASVHSFTTTEDVVTPGLFGKTAITDDDLGTEIDISYGYQYSSNVGIQVGVANFSGGDLIDASTFQAANDSDSIMRVWGQLRLRF